MLVDGCLLKLHVQTIRLSLLHSHVPRQEVLKLFSEHNNCIRGFVSGGFFLVVVVVVVGIAARVSYILGLVGIFKS